MLTEDIAEDRHEQEEKRDQGHEGKTGDGTGQHEAVVSEKVNKALPGESRINHDFRILIDGHS